MAGQRKGLNVTLQRVVRRSSESGQHLQQQLGMPLPGQCVADGIAPNQSREEEEFHICMHGVHLTLVACKLPLCCLLGLRSWVQDLWGRGSREEHSRLASLRQACQSS